MKKVYNPAQYWITGPSGTGKTFNLLIHILKSRRIEKNIILLHITLYEQYLNQFTNFFFNDLVYAFFPLLEHQSFPVCQEIEQKTESPLKDWLLYILLEIERNPRDLNCLYRFLFAAKKFLGKSNKKFIIIVDQTNIYQRRKKLAEIFEGFVNCFIFAQSCELKLL